MADLLDAVDSNEEDIKPVFNLNSTDSTPGKLRRRMYSAELKAQVVKQVESGYNGTLVAQIHGISKSLVSKLKHSSRPPFLKGGARKFWL